jgi:Ca2+/H+ antiporter, TMEM165/GDT1 family
MSDVFTLAMAAMPAFLASLVEMVEALTVVLAVGITRGWRDALLGTAAALLILGAMTMVIGTAFTTLIPLHLFQVIVGGLLLLFGLRWLRKALLRFAGIMALHDEDLIYQREVAALRAQGVTQTGVDWAGVTVTCKAVLLEGLEVVFVVLTLGAQDAAAFHAALWGALAAGLLVLLVGLVLHQPLTRVPENWLKYSVGALLCSFGVFWGAEGLGAVWPWDALTLVGILAVFLVVSWGSVRMLQRMLPQGAHIAARNI